MEHASSSACVRWRGWRTLRGGKPMKSSWVEIDKSVLGANIAALRKAVRPSTEIIFVVKANAYGHGLAAMARESVRAGVRWLAVAHLHEAQEVRLAVPDARILVMGVVEPGDAALLGAERITPIVVGAGHGRALAAEARAAGVTLDVHLKVDTGMGRLGAPWQEAAETFRVLRDEPGLRVTGLCSHFAAVEQKQPQRAEEQAERFLALAREAEALNGQPLFKHISSSRAILYHPEWDLDAIRPGICLYGYGTDVSNVRFHTRPFLQWKSSVMQVKSVPAGYSVGYYGTHVTSRATRIAVLSVGYADGYHRALSNRGHVLIRGRRCPVIGRVSMNWVTVDVGAVDEVEAGDEAVLVGEQGGVSVWAGELAKICRTIPYEILVGIDRVAERRYVNGASTSLR